MELKRDFAKFINEITSGCLQGVEICYMDEYLNKSDGIKRPIHHACKENNADIVRFLLFKGCDTETVDECGWRAIDQVAYHGYDDILRLLIEHNCEMESANKYGWRPIHRAALKGHAHILRLLMEHGCDMAAADNDGWQVVHYAANHGHLNILQLLLNHNYSIEAVDMFGWRPIHYASSKGHTAILKLLLDHNCDYEAQTEDGMRPSHHAANNGHTDILNIMIQHNCDMEAETKKGWRLIHFASHSGYVNILQMLIDNNCNLEAVDINGWGAVHYAASKGHVHILRLLMYHNCNIEVKTKDGLRAIHYAENNGHVQILQELLDHNCEMGSEIKDDLRSIQYIRSYMFTNILQNLIGNNRLIDAHPRNRLQLLHYAVTDGNVIFLQTLIDNNCDLEEEDKNGWRAIHFAAWIGLEEMMKMLMYHNCNIEAEIKDGARAIHFAVFNGHTNIVLLLINGSCNIESQTKYGLRPIHVSAKHAHVDILQALISNKCNIEAEDTDHLRAIHYAAANGHAKTMELLIANNCNIEAETIYGWRAIHYAASNGHGDILQALADHNCDLEAQTKDRWRAVHHSANYGHLNTLQMLLNFNCNKEAQTEKGCKPIHYAAYNGHLKVLQLLLDHNCDLEAQTESGWRPIHYAAFRGHCEFLQALIDQNCNIEAQTKNGQRVIHQVACNGHLNALKVLLDHNCNIEAQTENGWRAIHYASNSGHLAILEMLIDYNCDINCRTNYFRTALLLACGPNKEKCINLLRQKIEDRKETTKLERVLMRGSRIAVVQILTSQLLSKIMDPRENTTVLDRVLEINNTEVIDALKTKPVSVKELYDFLEKKPKLNLHSLRILQECLLYRCIRHENGTGFLLLCTANVVNSNSLFMGPSVLETVSEFDRVIYVKMVLSKLKDMNESWTRAINIAHTNKCNEMISMLSNRQHYLKLQYKDGYTRLHIAVFDNDPEMVEYILADADVDPDDGSKTVGTALSHAYSRKLIECIRKFEDKRVNVNTVNSRQQTPLDIAICNGMGDNSDYLIDAIDDVNRRDQMGLTFLEKAVIGGSKNAVEKLLRKGAKYGDRINIYPQWLDVDPDMSMVVKRPCLRKVTCEDTLVSLCLKINGTIYPCLLKILNSDSINQKLAKDDTILHLAASLLLPNICSQLILRGAIVDSLNAKGQTALFKIIDEHANNMDRPNNEEDLLKTVKVLIDQGASINIKDIDGRNLLEKATDCSERLLLALIRREEPLLNIEASQLLAWFQKHYFNLLYLSLPRINVALVQKWITFDVINCSMTVAGMDLTLLMLDLSESSVYSHIVERVLYKAAHLDDEALFGRLINTEISNENVLDDGESLLHCLIKEGNIKYCKLIMRSDNVGLLVEKKNAMGKLPIHICIENDVQELMNVLIIETRGLNVEDNVGHTPLTLLLEKISNLIDEEEVARTMLHIKMLINKSADIYQINRFSKMVISFCQNSDRRSEIQAFFNRQRPSSKASNEREDMMCHVCVNNRVDCVFECGHVICMTCSQQLHRCPLCRYTPTNPKRLLI